MGNFFDVTESNTVDLGHVQELWWEPAPYEEECCTRSAGERSKVEWLISGKRCGAYMLRSEEASSLYKRMLRQWKNGEPLHYDEKVNILKTKLSEETK